MKKILLILSVFIYSITSFSQVKNLQSNATFNDFLVEYSNQNDSIPKIIKRMAKRWMPRLAPTGNCTLASNALMDYASNYDTYTSDTYSPNWYEIGPIGTNNIDQCTNGQVHNIVFDPNYNGTTNNTLYACSSYGGLWRSENNGTFWQVVNTDTAIPVTTVADLAINPNDSNILFLATGRADGGTVHYGSRAGGVNPVFSQGVYRSTDYGENWHSVNSGLVGSLNERMNIREIEINPLDPDIMFLGTDNGLFRTTNGTDSDPFWSQVFTGLGGYFDTEFKGIAFKPHNYNTVYVSGQDIYRSEDSGDTWISLTSSYGLVLDDLLPHIEINEVMEPAFLVNRINITVTQASTENVYAYINGTERYWQGSQLKKRARMYIYLFNGTEWIEINHYSSNSFNTYNYTRIPIAVSPINPNLVYFGNIMVKGNNNILEGGYFSSRSGYSMGINDGYHADIHALEFAPLAENPGLFCGSDGGMSYRENPLDTGVEWNGINNGLGLTLLWSFDDSESNRDYILGAFQDNSLKMTDTNIYNKDPWEHFNIMGDGYGAQINDVNDKNAFFCTGTYAYRFDYQTDDLFMEMYHFNSSLVQGTDYRPWDPSGTNLRSWLILDFEIKTEPKSEDMYWTFSEINKRLHENTIPSYEDDPDQLWDRVSNIYTNEGLHSSWQRQINRFEISENNPDYRYLVTMAFVPGHTTDYKSHVFKVTDGSSNYTEVEFPGFDLPGPGPGVNDVDTYPIVSDIVLDPTNPDRIWISYTGFNGSFKVAFSDDAGVNWTSQNQGLPNLPVNAIVYQKGSNDILYAATDAGIYVKNGSSDWEKYGACPNVVVEDLKINYCNNKLRIATFGRGIWEADIIPVTGDLPEIVFTADDGTSGVTTWDAEVDRGLRNSVKIEAGATLVINGKISMPRDGKITIKKGGKLILDGGILTNNCDGIWKGIILEGDSSIVQSDSNQGVIEIINGGVIEYAEIGILADQKPGGIIRANDAIFRDNIIGIQMDRYLFDNISFIKNSTFETTSYLYNLNTEPVTFIKLNDIHTIKMRNNTFENLSDFEFSNNRGKGIFAVNSSVILNQNSFTLLYKALDYSTTGIEVTNTVSNNTFVANRIATITYKVDNLEYISNDINMSMQGTAPAFGLLLKSSNGFHVEDNEFYSTSDNFNIGTYLNNCDAANTIYRNQYHELQTAIYASGNNTEAGSTLNEPDEGLQVICNTFNDNEKAIYVSGNGKIATYQGEKLNSAGNTFSPECSGSNIEFNNLGDQVTYFFDDIPEYEPLCNYNINLFEAAVQNDCASQLDSNATVDEIGELKTQKDAKKDEIQVLTDGGDTEGLNETVEESQDDEALRLREKLLSESPNLSEKVMLSATSVEDVLPSVMVKDVLAANPKAAKSDKVQKALDERAEQLPDYMRYEIDLGKEQISEKELLENELSKIIHTREDKINTHITNMLKDSLTNNATAIENLLLNENKLNRRYQLVAHYLTQNDVVSAQTIMNNIPTSFELTENLQSDFNNRLQFFNLNVGLRNADLTWYDLSEEQRTIIDNLATDSESVAGLQARAVLAMIENQDFGVPEITFEDESPKSYQVATEEYAERLNVNPPIANDYFIIDYALDSKESYKDVTFVVYDNQGHNLVTKQPTTKANQYLNVCENWQEGVYYCRKLVNGMLAKEVQFVIDRTKSNDFDIINNDALTIYPNPANDYFVVEIGDNYVKNATLQIVDIKGSLVQSTTLGGSGNQLVVNTTTWQRGVYIVSLSSDTKLIETFKIVIE